MMKSYLIFLTIVLAVVVQATPVYWSGNSHRYEAVLATVNWTTANNAAIAAGGYLATVTSAEENAFLYSLVSSNNNFWFMDSYNNGIGPWLGGYQPDGSQEPTGGWQWVTGENFSYTNWASGEPNNFQGAENRVHFFGHQTLKSAQWNDISYTGNLHGYIIEYNAPEPNTLALFGVVLLLLGALRKKH